MPRFGETCKGHTIPYGTLSNTSLELRSTYYRYMLEENLPPLPDIKPDPINYYEPDEEHEFLGFVLQAVQNLTRREQQVIAMRFLQDFTLDECSAALDVTRERVRQIEARALRRLRQHAIDAWRKDERQRELRAKEYEDRQWYERTVGKVTVTVDGKVLQ